MMQNNIIRFQSFPNTNESFQKIQPAIMPLKWKRIIKKSGDDKDKMCCACTVWYIDACQRDTMSSHVIEVTFPEVHQV